MPNQLQTPPVFRSWELNPTGTPYTDAPFGAGSLEKIKRFLNYPLDAGITEEDSKLTLLLRSAEQTVSKLTNVVFRELDYRLQMSSLPNPIWKKNWTGYAQWLELDPSRFWLIPVEHSPATSIVSFKYTDVDLAEQTLDPSAYRLFNDEAYGPLIVLTETISDLTNERLDAIRIVIRMSSGTTVTDPDVERTILSLASYWYQNPELNQAVPEYLETQIDRLSSVIGC